MKAVPLTCAAVLLAACLFTPAALARITLPTPYGPGFFSADVAAPAPLPPRQGAPDAPAWEARIREAQFRGGPYAPNLAEMLQDAGSYFYGRGDISSAIAHWRRAVHLMRVNDGLYTRLQLPTLERLLEVYLQLGDYASADAIQSYLYFLRRRHHAPGEMSRIDATVAWVDWRRRQWLRAPTPLQPKPLLTLWRQLDREVSNDDEAPMGAARLSRFVYAQLDLLYVVSSTDFGPDLDTELMRGAGTLPDAMDMGLLQAQRLQDAAYFRGRRLLERLAERMAAAGNRVGEARALLAQGDWHTWYKKPASAAQRYRECWAMLAGQPALRQAWFDSPVALPADGALWTGPGSAAEFADTALVTAAFRVTRRGRVEELATEPAEPAGEGAAIRLKRLLRGSRFRPRLEAGEPVDSGPLVRGFRVR